MSKPTIEPKVIAATLGGTEVDVAAAAEEKSPMVRFLGPKQY